MLDSLILFEIRNTGLACSEISREVSCYREEGTDFEDLDHQL